MKCVRLIATAALIAAACGPQAYAASSGAGKRAPKCWMTKVRFEGKEMQVKACLDTAGKEEDPSALALPPAQRSAPAPKANIAPPSGERLS